MCPPISLYIIEVSSKGVPICDLQFSAKMKRIAALIKRQSLSPQQDMNTTATNMTVAQISTASRATILVCEADH